MANNDQSQYVLRYNQISGGLEFDSGNNWSPIDIGGGVTSIETDGSDPFTGVVNFVAGDNITLTADGNDITIDADSGGSTITSYVPTIDGVGTPSVVQFFYKTDGVVVEVWGSVRCGVTNTDPLTISLPVSVHAAHLPTVLTTLGLVSSSDSDAVPNLYIGYDGSTVTEVAVYHDATATPGNQAVPIAANVSFNEDSYFSVHFSYPIA